MARATAKARRLSFYLSKCPAVLNLSDPPVRISSFPPFCFVYLHANKMVEDALRFGLDIAHMSVM